MCADATRSICSTATVTIVVRPQAAQIPLMAEEDASADVNLLALNLPSIASAGSISIGEKPLNGKVALNHETGVATYTPHKSFFGLDSFSYRGKI